MSATSNFNLHKLPLYRGCQGPLLLIILDGMGIYKTRAQGYYGNAIDQARTPNLDRLLVREKIKTNLKAHGTAVGMPSDKDMGNSEVGHNALGAGRIFDQGAKLVNAALDDGALFKNDTWMEYVGNKEKPGHLLHMQANDQQSNPPAIHFIGLLSDGNVHSHINHLLALIEQCAAVGVKNLFVHTLLDGRDVEEISAERYIQQLEAVLARHREHQKNYWIASGGGRMVITMDRYQANWSWVEKGWETHVHGNAPRFPNALSALKTFREKYKGIIDQDLPPFVVTNDQREPIGPIRDHDVVIFFNFRGDRAIEISKAFTDPNFNQFERGRTPQVKFAGMMEYDGDLHIPPRYLVTPPAINRTVSEYLVHNGIEQLALSETQKFGHVTYFWNGNNSEKFDKKLETWIEIQSDNVPFETMPQMKATEITNRLIDELKKKRYRFIRINFANGDMVGHTGNLPAAIQAVEAVDRNLSRILSVMDSLQGTVVITADHGNCEQMIEVDKKTGLPKLTEHQKPMPKTSHTLCPVPFIVHGPDTKFFEFETRITTQTGIAHITATLLFLLGYTPPGDFLPSLLTTSTKTTA